MNLCECTYQAPDPLGTLTLVGSDAGLRAVLFATDLDSGRVRPARGVVGAQPVLARTVAQLDRYFSGTLRRFELPLDLRGTAFQLRAWGALAAVPYGHTITYGMQAARLGNPKAGRAVGAANGRNPVSIVLPCHRLIGGNGSLTGFGGGLAAKAWLLEHERRRLLEAEARVDAAAQ